MGASARPERNILATRQNIIPQYYRNIFMHMAEEVIEILEEETPPPRLPAPSPSRSISDIRQQIVTALSTGSTAHVSISRLDAPRAPGTSRKRKGSIDSASVPPAKKPRLQSDPVVPASHRVSQFPNQGLKDSNGNIHLLLFP